VTVHTYWFAWSEIGSGAEKWHPTTRESADHSLPYILAAVLIDGRFSDDIFSESRIRDARIQEMASRIAVNEDKDYSRQFPAKIRCRIEIRTKSGKELTAQVDYPRGHTSNPMTDEEVWGKFRMLAGRKLPKEQVEQALEAMLTFDTAKGLDPLFQSSASVADAGRHRAGWMRSGGKEARRRTLPDGSIARGYCFALRCRPSLLNCDFCSSLSEA
jgi:2-methylcitrate dehydratase